MPSEHRDAILQACVAHEIYHIEIARTWDFQAKRKPRLRQRRAKVL
jgi:hypothetical protein